MTDTAIVLAGATGALGERIAKALVRRGAKVRALVRRSTAPDALAKDDVADFTAAAALDPSTPRFLRIAGEQISARELAALMTDLTGARFRLVRAGGLGLLASLIKVARGLFPQPTALYSAWQGMQ